VSDVLERLEELSHEALRAVGDGWLPGLIGIDVLEIEGPRVRSRLDVRRELMAPIGYLHAATVVALADTTAGYGAWANLPEGASGFTTLELKTNFLGTARDGGIACEATLVHGGRSTQVWDAVVTIEGTAKQIALFRCTQMILYSDETRMRRAPASARLG
jgi:1,4-dihydroxy-2-naphthoyl-CoA hydrolase